MSFIGTLGPWALGFVGVAMGIIALYFLKLRREPVEVSSTYLWGKTLQDMHVNSLLQRLRRNLLLFLQLLIVALALLACYRPGLRDETNQQEKVIFLLDRSASMQATDMESGLSRFETAKTLIRGQIETLSDQQSAMLITFCDRSQTVQAFTSNRQRLAESLEGVIVSNRPTDILEALRAADGLANPRRSSQVGDLNDVQVAEAQPADLFIYSDGCFPELNEFSLGNLTPHFVSVGTQQVNNLAITEFSTQRDVDATNRVEVFAKVVNLGTGSSKTEVELKMDGELVDAALVSLDPDAEQGLSFELVADQFAVLTLTLTEPDDLMIDNTAFAGLTPARLASVLAVTEGNTALQFGLATDRISKMCDVEFVKPKYLDTTEYKKRALDGRDDLVIFDRCSPEQMPNASTFFIDAIPPRSSQFGLGEQLSNATAQDGATPTTVNKDENGKPTGTGVDDVSLAQRDGTSEWAWSGEASQLSIIDIDRTHPILRYLDLYSLLVFDGRPLQLPEGARELLTADIGPVMAIADRNGFQDVVLGFPILTTNKEGEWVANTNWYAERSWPVFLFNLLRTVANASESISAISYQPGDLVKGTLARRFDDIIVRTQSGRSVETAIRDQLRFETIDTEELGCYDVTSQENLLERFSVNLFQRSESAILAKKDVELGYETVNAGNVDLIVRREFWRIILMAVLAVILLEWVIYTKRLA